MRQKTPLVFIGAIITLSALLAGCISVEKGFPQKRFYILDVSRHGGTNASPPGPPLRVRKLRVSPRYEGKGFVYRTGELRYESDFYNEFLIPPESLLTEEVRQWLVQSGLFQYVTDSTSPLEPTYILEGTVPVLYGDYREGTSPKAALAMGFFLLRDVSARTKVVFRKQYRREVELKGRSPEELVKGWNEALRGILSDLERDLRAVNLKRAG